MIDFVWSEKKETYRDVERERRGDRDRDLKRKFYEKFEIRESKQTVDDDYHYVIDVWNVVEILIENVF